MPLPGATEPHSLSRDSHKALARQGQPSLLLTLARRLDWYMFVVMDGSSGCDPVCGEHGESVQLGTCRRPGLLPQAHSKSDA